MSLVWPILAHLSAEPLVGLKPATASVSTSSMLLSAEPLVGLKQVVDSANHGGDNLSAEPLVGLKPNTV